MTAALVRRLRAALSLCIAFATAAVSAASFTPGNVVVYRVGDGTAPLVTSGNATFLDEYSPTGALVQSIALPTAASAPQRPILLSGTALTDGLLTRSVDGTCLAVPGYGRDLGAATTSITTAAGIPRVVARVTAAGAVDTTTGLSDSATITNFRGAASVSCASFFVAGGTGGVRHALLGATTSTGLTAGPVGSLANVRGVAIYGNQLYLSASVATIRGVGAVGSGIPTAGNNPVVKLPGMTDANSPSIFGFFMADLDASVPGVDTLYVADEDAGLSKFSLMGGTWQLRGTVGSGADAYRGVTGVVSGTSVTLYATRGALATGGGQLVKLTDASGYDGILAGTPTTIATAGAAKSFRGVALAAAPAVTVTPIAGPNGSITPATPQVVPDSGSVTFTLTPQPGYNAVVGGTCAGNLVGNTFTTNALNASCTLDVAFTQIPFTVTPSAGPNGTIAPPAPRAVLPGTEAVFTVTPAPGYAASVGGTCGGNLVGTTYTTAPVTADCTVVASFTVITFNVTPSAAGGGSISPSAVQVVALGATAAFTVTPDFGFGAAVGGTCGGTLAGNTYTTNAITGDCTVEAAFAPLPRYTVTAAGGAHGSVSPATSGPVISGQPATITVIPDAGYNAAVRGTCGRGVLSGNTYTTGAITSNCTVTVTFARRLVLFVGNSYTFGRIDPVMSYNTANVSDLTLEMWLAPGGMEGSNPDEPHPWGGIPGVFKKLTDQMGLEYDVSISARNAASLRGHYLNTNPAGWDLRGNIASQRFDAIVLQDLSDEPLPAGRGANANLPYFHAYVDKIERWIHQGNAEAYTETQLFGGGDIATCRAVTGASESACETVRTVPNANPHARPQTEVYLYQTWARPDMIAPHGTNINGTFYSATEGLEAMTADFHASYFGRAAANPGIEDVSRVGDAFLRAVQDGVAMRDPYVPEAGKVNLWHTDFFHPSKYGSYLSALVHFATLTGLNPLALGPGEQAAVDLGIASTTAVQLQRVAQATVAPDTTPPVSAAAMSSPPNASGWHSGNVTVTFTAADEARGSGLDAIVYMLTGAQSGAGTLASGGTVAITAEGLTTLTWHAVDRAGNAEAARTLQFSIDRTNPAIVGMPGAGCSLWPPNHKMVEVATVSASGGASPVASFSVTATSSEPPSPGESDVAITGSGVGPREVALRAERLGSGPGRTYTITANATDAAGNTATAVATCVVRHDRGK
jgi:hypothetical protein